MNGSELLKERGIAIVYLKELVRLRLKYGAFSEEYVVAIDSLLNEEIIPWLKEINEDNTETNYR